MVAPLIIAGVSAASGIASAIGGYNQQNAEARARNEAARREYKQRLKIQEQQWTGQRGIYAQKLNQYNQQIREFDRAAALGYSREQTRQNELLTRAVFGQQSAQIDMARRQGMAAASGKVGRSAQRLDANVLKSFSRQQAIAAENLYSGQLASQQNIQDIQNRLASARNRAYGKVAIAPMKPLPLLEPNQVGGASTLGLIGNIGSSIAGAAGTYQSLTAPNPGVPNDPFKGLTPPPTP